MEIKTLTTKMHEFVQSKGWYEPGSHREQSPRNLAISLSLESSEVLEHFQWSENCKILNALADELADVSLYLFQLASVSGIDLETAILNKLSKNIHRDWNS